MRQVPEYVIYESFFFHVNWLDAQAAKRAVAGKPNDFFQSRIRRRVGLTAQEEATLKAVAADWKTQNDALSNEAVTLKASGASPEKLQALQARSKQTVLDRVAQLKYTLGPTRFFILDSFIRATSTVRGFEAVSK